MIDKITSVRLHYDWWKQCRTCLFWIGSDQTRMEPGICYNPQSPLYKEETWTEGSCEKWDSFDIETALEFLDGKHTDGY